MTQFKYSNCETNLVNNYPKKKKKTNFQALSKRRLSLQQKTNFEELRKRRLSLQTNFLFKLQMPPVDYNYFFNSLSKQRKPAPLRELTSLIPKLPADRINFGAGYPNANTFPFNEITINLNDGMSIKLQDNVLEHALQYLPSVGYSPLIELLKNFQDKMHGKQQWKETNLLITSGSQEGLSKSIDMCMELGDPVIIQHPVYPGAVDLFRPYKPEFILAEQDEYGIQPSLLNNLLAKRLQEGKPMPKLMYINPTGANPTGTTLPLNRRIEIYQLACIYNFLILEDDAYCYINFSDEKLKSFLAMDTEGRVLRFDSFSKILSPGLRIGFVTGPTTLLRRLELLIQGSSMHSSALSQVVLYNILKQWEHNGFMGHLNKIKRFYQMKRDSMVRAAERYLKGIAEWNIPNGGMFLWLRIPGLNDVRNLVMKKCIEYSLVIAPGYVFFENVESPSEYVRLSYSASNQEQIEKGMMLLSKAIKQELLEQNMNGLQQFNNN